MTAPATTHPRRPAALRLAAPLLALGLLTACAGGGEPAASPTPSETSTPTPSETPSESSPSDGASPDDGPTRSAPLPDVPVERYVAIGDSYTSAPYVPETERESGCLRSDSNYPQLVAETLEAGELQDVSCVGADATAMIGAQRTLGGGFVAPQFDALTEGTDLVTVGLGGNDFGVFSRLLAGCVERAEADPDGSPCRDAARRGGEDALLADLERTEERLGAVLRGVRDRLPDATVLLVGYPVLVPEAGTCPERLPLAEADYPYVRRVNLALNDALRGAAEATGTTYVDVGAASDGHDICAEEAWVNGDDTDEERALAFHPLAEGQQAVADLVLQAVARAAAGGAAA